MADVLLTEASDRLVTEASDPLLVETRTPTPVVLTLAARLARNAIQRRVARTALLRGEV